MKAPPKPLLSEVRTRAALGTLHCIAHELASPVGALEMNARALTRHLDALARAGTVDAADAEHLTLCHEIQRDVASSIQRLRALSDLLAARLATPPVEGGACDAVEVVRAAIAEHGEASAVPPVVLRAPPAVPAAVDRVALLIAFGAVLDNALEAAARHPDGRVRVDITADGTVSVEDDGNGLPVGDPRDALRPLHGDKVGHLGLGLTLAYELLRRVGGDVALMRAPRGTRVALRLPRAATARADDDPVGACPRS